MKDPAIRKLYPEAVTIFNDDYVIDKDGKEVVLDSVLIAQEVERLTAEKVNSSITNKATEIIESKYTPLKQRKLLAMLGELQQKKIDFLDGATTTNLTTAETELVVSIRAVNAWVGTIRTIENEAIANGIPLADINWGEDHVVIM